MNGWRGRNPPFVLIPCVSAQAFYLCGGGGGRLVFSAAAAAAVAGRAIPPGGPASVRGKGTGRGREGAPVYQPHHRPRPQSAGHSTLAS